MKLPVLISVPHSGVNVPPEVESYCCLNARQIIEDGDEGADEIYDVAAEAEAFITTDIARAVVDINRAQDDRRADGVIKTHTCWNIPIYNQPLPEPVIQTLLRKYYHPYHEQLSAWANNAKFGIDCHTMATYGPPVGPDPGQERPFVCLSNANETFPKPWMERLAFCFQQIFNVEISVNMPFKGGFIIQSHTHEMPWVQVEMSRSNIITNGQKRNCFWESISKFYEIMF